MGLILTGIIVVVGAGGVATLIAMAIHGHIRQETLTDFRDHSSLVSGVSGTLFAITVGMLVVASWGAIGDVLGTICLNPCFAFASSSEERLVLGGVARKKYPAIAAANIATNDILNPRLMRIPEMTGW